MAGWPFNPLAANQQSAPYPAQDWPYKPGEAPDGGVGCDPYSDAAQSSVPGKRVLPNLGYWSGDRATIPLTTPDVAFGWSDGVLGRGIWQSALLDLNPQLHASASMRPVATPIMSPGAYAQKQEARLQVEIERLATITIPGRFELRYIEYGSTTTSEATRQLNAPQDITPAFYSVGHVEGGVVVADGGEFVFKAPGHLRFWGVILVIDQVSGTLAASARFPWTVRGVAQ